MDTQDWGDIIIRESSGDQNFTDVFILELEESFDFVRNAAKQNVSFFLIDRRMYSPGSWNGK